ncbi:MAG: preprotein translocase subunit SecE [Candidatus Omnitrophica bacterium]|nr:preprotein translocase subunit SecE [Candidatus Omnitrophota bacterium]MCM8793588.1 preprotein translocase subunit SecE [Candidatus Omnitrophota bacterium]
MKKIKRFLQEVARELKKTSWTTKEEVWSSTLLVVVTVGVLSVFIGIVDFLLSQLVNFIIK